MSEEPPPPITQPPPPPIVWKEVTDENFKKVAGKLLEWHAYNALNKIPVSRELQLFQRDDSTFEIITTLENYAPPSLEEALALWDNNSAAFQLNMLTLQFVKETASTGKSTQALFGFLSHRIKKLEQVVDQQALSSASGYTSFAEAKQQTLAGIFALDNNGFYGNLLH